MDQSNQQYNLATFPGLTVEAVNKFFLDFDAIQKGHIKQQQQNARSMKVRAIENADEEDKNILTFGKKHRDAYLTIFDTTRKIM